MPKKRKSKETDPLSKWLALDWERPERSYNPDLQQSFAELNAAGEKAIATTAKLPEIPDYRSNNVR